MAGEGVPLAAGMKGGRKMRFIDYEKFYIKLLDIDFPVEDMDPILDAMDACVIDGVKHSEWIKTDHKPCISTKCEICGHRVEIQDKSRSCPGCGAKMSNYTGR